SLLFGGPTNAIALAMKRLFVVPLLRRGRAAISVLLARTRATLRASRLAATWSKSESITGTHAPEWTLTLGAVSKALKGQRTVKDVSLGVRSGEIVGLLGPDGSGKKAILDIIAGLATADSGRLTFAGHNITHLSRRRRERLGLVYVERRETHGRRTL